VDTFAGQIDAVVDDLVLQRNDGVPSYNVAVVVDDGDQDIGEVVRGDDLLPATPRHVLLQRLLGLPEPIWTHVPLVVGPDGHRLAKRHGARTLAGLAELGVGVDEVRRRLAASLGIDTGDATDPEGDATAALEALLPRFDPDGIPRQPWPVDPTTWVTD
jgi:glutamyl-tRNA synthetase